MYCWIKDYVFHVGIYCLSDFYKFHFYFELLLLFCIPFFQVPYAVVFQVSGFLFISFLICLI